MQETKFRARNKMWNKLPSLTSKSWFCSVSCLPARLVVDPLACCGRTLSLLLSAHRSLASIHVFSSTMSKVFTQSSEHSVGGPCLVQDILAAGGGLSILRTGKQRCECSQCAGLRLVVQGLPYNPPCPS